MIGIYTSSQVRDAEAKLMRTVPPGSLMQEASFGLAMALLQQLREVRGRVYGARVLLLVGPGGNGGDALYAGIVLLNRGVGVTAVLVSDRTYPGALGRFVESGGARVEGDVGVVDAVAEADLLVDGIAGLGSGREVGLPDAVRRAVDEHPCVVAVDVPSGVNADTGSCARDAIRARVAVTFGCYKPAHFLAPAAELCGEVAFVDVGLGDVLPPASAGVLTADEVWERWPRQPYTGHKYSTGVVGIAAGSAKYAGAAVLAVGGALRAKPGMVRFVGDSPAGDRVIDAWPECVVSPTVADAGRAQAWVVGPGIGTDSRAQRLFDDVLQLDVPTVIDADALTMLKGRLGDLSSRTAPAVLTPHAGEFERIFWPVSNPLEEAQRAAEVSGCVVLLKGPSTIVAAPGFPALINSTGTARLATAGTGDVLAGIIGSLMAAGIEPRMAAAMGAHAHGAAATAAPGSMVAGDLPGLLRKLLDRALT